MIDALMMSWEERWLANVNRDSNRSAMLHQMLVNSMLYENWPEEDDEQEETDTPGDVQGGHG